jgi:hypothetical protein
MSNTGISQVDLTAVNAVQSLFGGPRDPWAVDVAADFVDFMLWNDFVRFPVLVREGADEHREIVIPPLLNDLRRRESEQIVADVQFIAEQRKLSDELAGPALRAFATFCRLNPSAVKKFYALHTTGWIKQQIESRSGVTDHYVFDVVDLKSRPEFNRLELQLDLPYEAIFYILDLILKYLIYAERAQHGRYLTHPIRSLQDYSSLGVAVSDSKSLRIPFRLGPYIIAAAQSRNQDWFGSKIYEARSFVRELGINHGTNSAQVSQEVLRELAVRLGLPGKIRAFERVSKVATVAEASGGILGSMASGNPWPAVAGSTLTIATTVWSGGVPGALARLSWVRWMCEWDIEKDKRAAQT